jgi:cytochrome c oxidase subunit 2
MTRRIDSRGAGPGRRRVLAGAAGLGAALLLARVWAADERVVTVVAKKFVFVPDEIHLKQGETVVIELTAPEVTMGFSAPELGIRTDIVPGVPTRVRLTPGKPGRFLFNCDVFCGSGHEDMDGVIVVEPA